MAYPRVFISSSCYDLREIRDTLFSFIEELNYIPVLSDKGDVFYHPDIHTHDSCIHEIETFHQNFRDANIGLVVPITSLLKSLKTVFGAIGGLKTNMVIGPSDAVKKEYDILIVDEAHRLAQRKNIPNYGSFDATNR